MGTLAEIETAIETLPVSQAKELAAWLNRRLSTQSIDALQREPCEVGKRKSMQDFFGCLNSGDPHSGDNDRIDADLARELTKELGFE